MNPPEKITVTTAHFECRMCPTIIVGTSTEGETVYVRYRWGRLTVRIDPRDPAPNGGAAGVWIMFKELDVEGLAGCISYDEIRELTSEMIDWPEELSPMPPNQTDDDQSWLGPPNPLDL
jgi:hypothetical protein